MIGVSVIVAALGIGAGSTSTDQAKEHLASVVAAEKSENAVLKREVKRLRKSNHDWHDYARSQEIAKARLLSLVAALRRKLHPPAPKTGVPSWFYRAIMCIHGRESSDWRYGAPGHGSNGFEGGLQFLNSTWLSSGGGKFAQHAYDASPSEQITVAYWLYKRSGFGPWPNTARACGVL
jgi:hypothetical protein